MKFRAALVGMMCAGSYRSQVVLSLWVMNQSWAPAIEIVTQGYLCWTSYNAGFGVPAIFGRSSESFEGREWSHVRNFMRRGERSFIDDMSMTMIM